MDVITPQGQAGADVVGQLRHEEALSHLRRARQYVSTGVEQTVDDGRSASVHGVVELRHGHRLEVVRGCHFPHFPLLHLKIALLVIL